MIPPLTHDEGWVPTGRLVASPSSVERLTDRNRWRESESGHANQTCRNVWRRTARLGLPTLAEASVCCWPLASERPSARLYMSTIVAVRRSHPKGVLCALACERQIGKASAYRMHA